MRQIGPTKLILINCGKFDYAEIDLDKPLHLIGPNNIGKTSLIAVLQFLYISNQNKMKFSSEMDTTRRYYFSDVSSFALFESLGPEGFSTLGVRGLGPVKKFDFERFSYRGRFIRDDYLSLENQVLSWDIIQANLAHKNYTKLSPANVQDALIGNENRTRRNDASPNNLSLVPLRRRGEYDRFCSIFLNLLRLAHIRQDELKELLLQLYEGEFTKIKIDLLEEFAPQLKRLQAEKTDTFELRKLESSIRKILEGVAERDELRGKLKSFYECIINAYNTHEECAKKQCMRIEEEIQQRKNQIDQNDVLLQELENQKDDKNTEKGKLENTQQLINTLEVKFQDFNLDLVKANIIELETKDRTIESQLDMAQSQSPESIKRRLVERESQLDILSGQLDNLDKLLITSLMGNLDQDQIDKLSRLFNDAILKLPTKGKNASAIIKDQELLLQYLNHFSEDFSDYNYANDAISLDLKNVHHFDIEEYTDPDRIRENINYHQKDISNLKLALVAAENNLKLRQELKDLKQKMESLRSEQAEYNHFIGLKEDNRDLPKRLKTVLSERSKILKNIDSIRAKQAKLSAENKKLESNCDKINNKLTTIREKVSRILKPEDDWIPVDYDVAKVGIDDMLYSYMSMSTEYQGLAKVIEGEFSVIHNETYGRYQANSEKESLVKLQNELDALEAKQKALEESWVSFITLLKKDFQELNRDMARLRSKVNSLNHNLSKVQISNLTNLKINVLERPELKIYFNEVEDSEQTPLFSDATQTNEAVNKISKLLQDKPLISLKDMFDMQFEITAPNGEVKKYDHLDRIESNGTTITIKVLINLILLRGLLSNDHVNMPFYLDECSSLDSENLRSIVDQARKQGFIAILASPEAMDAADHLYYLYENNGRVTLNPQSRLIVETLQVNKGGDVE